MLSLFILGILAFILGIFLGLITGLIPGLHINLIASSLIIFSTSLLPYFSAFPLTIFIVSLTISNVFFAFFPSIFLGCPDEENFLSILPGHELLLKGRGHEASLILLIGGMIGIFLFLLVSPALIFLIPKIYYYLKYVILFMLLFTSFYLIYRDKENRTLSFVIFFLSGLLGLSTILLPIKQSLLPLLTGLFGASSLISSIIKKEKVPKQKTSSLREIKLQGIFSSSVSSILVAPLCSFLPALGTGQAAIIASDITGETDRKKFLILIGILNTMLASLAFLTLYTIGKTRTGSAVALHNILPNFSLSSLIIILSTILISGITSFLLAILISKFFSNNISKVNYRILSIIILAFLSILVFYFSGWLGFLLFIVASFLGLFTILSNIRRTHLMGSLMLPSIIYYLPF